MKPEKYDFGGYATKNDVLCTDGRVIRQDAFKHDDGRVVPLVWQHGSNDPSNILGHAYLENRADGVYAYSVFNDSPNAKNAKDLVEHKAINSLSIYANKLGQIGKDVMSGVIREVSLVLSAANPGAMIDTLAFSHGEFDEDADADEAIIYSGEDIALSHADEVVSVPVVVPELAVVVEPATPVIVPEVVHADAVVESATEETVGDILGTLNEEQKAAVGFLIDAVDDPSLTAADSDSGETVVHESGRTVSDVLATLNDKQKAAVGFLIDELEKDKASQGEDTSVQHSETENSHMSKNVFDDNADDAATTTNPLTHEDFVEITELAKKRGSFKDAFIEHMSEKGYELAHAETYGLNNIGVLFPDAKSVTPTPEFVRRDNTWVGIVMSGTHHTPFSRIKSFSADITADEARAKGYVTGNEKVDEVFDLLSRSTTPTTIYKKQKLDRDDVVDITDFDVVMWLRGEMRIMLDEEIARAILIGDGRPTSSNDKIKEANVRPIYTDAELYAHHIELVGTDAEAIIDEIVHAMKYYKGSGSPTLFCAPDVVTDMLLIKDTLHRRMYATLAELAAALRVKDIVEVEVMTGAVNAINQKPLFGIVVNLNDYTVGADKGGDVNAFDDFDINFNQYHYLIETRISGALTKPKSAIVLEQKVVAGG